MADPPDFEQLAKRYLDLWQDQLAAAASDPEAIKNMSRFAALFKQAAFGWVPGEAAATPRNRSDDEQSEAENRAAAAGAPSADGAGDVAELARRVVDLEARVAALERRAKPARKPRAKRSP